MKGDAPGSDALSFWDPQTGARLGPTLSLPSEPRRVAFNRDGTRVAVFCAGKEVLVIEPETVRVRMRLVHESAVTDARICSLLFTPEGDRLVTTGFRSAQVWDLSTGRRAFPPFAHDGIIFSAGLAHDGRTLATGASDGFLRVWDLADGRPAMAPAKHGDWVYQVTFSPNDRFLALGCRDGSARVWDWRAGRVAAPALRHEHEVFALAFTPDGGRLVTLTLDGRVRAWDWPAGKPLSPAIVAEERPGGSSLSLDVFPSRPGAGPEVVVAAPRSSLALRLADLITPGNDRTESLILRAELVSNQTLQHGEPLGLTIEEWRARWLRFQASHPGDAAAVARSTWDERARAAEAMLQAGSMTAALELLDGLASERPAERSIHLVRAAVLVHFGRRPEAAAALARAMELDPDDHYAWYQRTTLTLSCGGAEEYLAHCRRMLERFAETSDLMVAERISKACALAPLPAREREMAARLAERADGVGRAQRHWIVAWALLAHALVDYRAGRFESARARADECLAIEPAPWNRAGPAHLIRAMVAHQQGSHTDARSALERARAVLRDDRPKPWSRAHLGEWHDWENCELLRREAEALILHPDLPENPFAGGTPIPD